jgi:3-hydroxyisobutyrate dehydrogenase
MNAVRQTVGVVGLGVIGEGLVRVLSSHGHPLVGFDVSDAAVGRLQPSIRPAGSPREVAEAADVVIVAVHGDDQVRAVVAGDDGLLAAERPAPHVVVVSTVTLETIRWAADAAAARQVQLLDCGITGGQRLREEGRLVAMLGGDDDAVAAVRPVVELFGAPTLHMGGLGTGMRAKIARNMIIYGCWYIASEAARLAHAGGVDVEQLAAICDAADHGVSRPVGLLRDADPSVPARERLLGFVHKDLGAALALGEELGVELPAAELVERTSDALLGRVGSPA